MKQFLLGLSISFAFIAGCVAATAAQNIVVPVARSAEAATYEYTCHHVRLRDITMADGPVAVLNQYGAKGWRIVPLDWGDYLCFERG